MFRMIAAATLFAIVLSTPLVAQETSTPAAFPDWASGSLVEVPVDELTIRLVPLDLESLELLRVDVMARVRVNANELADAIVARLKLAKAGDEADQEINAVGERTISLMIDKERLIARANVLVEAIEAKGGDVASDQAYLEAIESLRPDLAATVGRDRPQAGKTDEPSEMMQARVAELVDMVRAELPGHRPQAELHRPLGTPRTAAAVAHQSQRRAIDRMEHASVRRHDRAVLGGRSLHGALHTLRLPSAPQVVDAARPGVGGDRRKTNSHGRGGGRGQRSGGRYRAAACHDRCDRSGDRTRAPGHAEQLCQRHPDPAHTPV